MVLNSKKDHFFVKSFVGDIVQIIGLAKDKCWIPESSKVQIINIRNTEIVKIDFSGVCTFRLGIEQHINLNEEEIK